MAKYSAISVRRLTTNRIERTSELTDEVKVQRAMEVIQLPSGGGFKKFWKLESGLKPIPHGWSPKPFEGVQLVNLQDLSFCGGVLSAIENELSRGNRDRIAKERVQRRPNVSRKTRHN